MVRNLERVISLLGSLASILGVSALSAFAIFQSFREQAFDIGYKLTLSTAAVVLLAMFFPLFLLIFRYILQLLFNTTHLDEDNEEDLGVLNVLGAVYTSISLIVFVSLLIGLLLMIWSREF